MTTTFQKASLALYFGVGAIVNPRRGDLVAGLGDITAEVALKSLRHKLIGTDDGQILLKEKHLVDNKLLRNKSFCVGTLGFQYSQYMELHGFNANERSAVRFIEDPELAYLMTRYRQVHDFLHVICDLEPTVLEELALKWYLP